MPQQTIDKKEREEILRKIARYLYEVDGIEISDRIIEAMLKIDRRDFVLPSYIDRAYEDAPLPIPDGQTISAIHMVMILLHYADLNEGMKIMEIGTGSGYLTALIAELIGSGKVVSIEYSEKLHRFAKENLSKYSYDNIILLKGDGKEGYPPMAPYDRIICSAATKEIPKEWKEQISPDGFILTPLYVGEDQYLIKYYKENVEKIMRVAFVPLK